MKNKAWIIGLIGGLLLSGCTSAVSNSSQPAAEEVAPSFESTGWECTPSEDFGSCATTTFDGASGDLNWDEIEGVPFGGMMIVCWRDSEEALVTVIGGSSLQQNVNTNYLWNPASYPRLDYSIDGAAKKSTAYEITDGYGEPQPDTIVLLRTWPTIMRDIASANTLQIWLADSTGTERQVDINVEGSVGAVATLAGWGYGCGF